MISSLGGKTRLISAVVVLLIMALTACNRAKTNTPASESLHYALPFLDTVDLDLQAVLQSPEGTVANLAHLRGKIVVLEFWATWCGPCIHAIPHLNEVAKQCQGDPIVFISITCEDKTTVQKFLAGHPMAGWVGIDKPTSVAGVGETASRFGVLGIPHTVVIDQYGFLIAHLEPCLITREGLLNITKARPFPPPTKAATPAPTTSGN